MDRNRYFSAVEARAYLILVRDGLYSTADFFARTKNIPDKYISWYKRISDVEDIEQVAHLSHLNAIRTYPIASDINFLGWAGQTVKRDIISHILASKRCSKIKNRVKENYNTEQVDYDTPEEIFFKKECSVVLEAALESVGKTNRSFIEAKLDNNLHSLSKISYFRRKNKLSYAMSQLRNIKVLKDYI